MGSLGEGLNASVYKVSKTQPNLRTEHIFALKVLKQSSDLRVFKTEFETLLKAHGKHLVRYFGWETHNNMPALLLEYIDGCTLYELFQVHTFKFDELHWLYQEISKGLRELETCGLFHGDLSLKNIMMQKDGQIKLIDFGLSHWSTQRVELTPEYADSTLLAGSKPSYATDLVSLKKIFQKIAPQFDVSQVKDSKHKTHPPQSFLEKISDLDQPDQHTQKIHRKSANCRLHKRQNKLFWLATSVLFFTPASATNALKDQGLYKIRTASWAQIFSPSGESCFTPCTLELQKGALLKLKWQKQGSEGVETVFTGSVKTLHLKL